MNFYNKTTEKITLANSLNLFTSDDVLSINELYNVSIPSKWFPVLFSLDSGKKINITEISKEINQSEAIVTQLIDEISIAGGILNDTTENIISLSEHGQNIIKKINEQTTDIEAALDSLMMTAESKEGQEYQLLLQQKSLFKRVQEQKKQRESKGVEIIDYTPDYQPAFRSLNVEWISKYFVMEETDYKSLDHPDDYIISKGGRILIALLDGETVGVCALIKMHNSPYDYEMAKMAVSPKAQGKSIGFLLGKAVANLAKELGASKLYLESNTVLAPALNLYRKLGFVEVKGLVSPYKRCNIQMVLDLE